MPIRHWAGGASPRRVSAALAEAKFNVVVPLAIAKGREFGVLRIFVGEGTSGTIAARERLVNWHLLPQLAVGCGLDGVVVHPYSPFINRSIPASS